MLAGVALIATGGADVLAGVLDQHGVDQAYVVGFKHPGDACGSDGADFDIGNGQPLSCVPSGEEGVIGRLVHLHGFTDAQDDQVGALAERLGAGGVSPGEQREIQGRVNRILASVPPADRAGHGSEFWGISREVWLGLAMLAAGFLLVGSFFWVVFTRAARTNRRVGHPLEGPSRRPG